MRFLTKTSSVSLRSTPSPEGEGWKKNLFDNFFFYQMVAPPGLPHPPFGHLLFLTCPSDILSKRRGEAEEKSFWRREGRKIFLIFFFDVNGMNASAA